MDKYIDESLIGIIDFSNCIDEALIGYTNLKSLGQCNIYVYGKEGQIPHFHLFNDNGFETCIWIYDNKYFPHGGKYRDILNSNQMKELYRWMNVYSRNTPAKITNWESIVLSWNTNNPDCRYKDKCDKCPRYDIMDSFRVE